MGFKKNSLLGIVVIVTVTLLLQYIFLTVLFQKLDRPSRQTRHIQHPLAKHHPRSLSNVQTSDTEDLAVNLYESVVNKRVEPVRESKRPVVSAEEKILQRKRSRERVEELEKAPKQSSKEQGVAEEGEEGQTVTDGPSHPGKSSDKEVTGLRGATIRYNASARPTGTVKVITSKPQDIRRKWKHQKKSDHDAEEDHQGTELLAEKWRSNQLKLVKANSKLSSYLTQTVKPMEAYWHSLKIPGLKRGESVHDHVAHIQSLGKSIGLEKYVQEFCAQSGEPLLECMDKPMRKLSPYEEQGRNIMFTLRTTKDYHETRLGTLFETWVTTLYPESLFVVTDDEDTELEEQLEGVGMHYINAKSGHTHFRADLCCKAGVELELMFQPENKHFNWVCHVDDDMYVHVQPLAKQLSKFSPRTDPVYIGRSGSEWGDPRVVNVTSKLGKPGQRFHFAVGGMYCLSRAMLELARPYLVGCHTFSDSCNKTQQPEDVTVGLVTGVILKKPLTRTDMIWSHGLNLLSSVPASYIREQIAFSHGYGSGEPWTALPNVVFVPGALFSIDEDITQFKSIHCHIYPKIYWCVDQKKMLVEEKRKAKGNDGKVDCICSWETFLCCEVMKKTYFEAMSQVIKSTEADEGGGHKPDSKAHKEQRKRRKAKVDPG